MATYVLRGWTMFTSGHHQGSESLVVLGALNAGIVCALRTGLGPESADQPAKPLRTWRPLIARAWGITALVLLLAGALGYLWCDDSHMCMAGQMKHPPYPPWHRTVDLLWLAAWAAGVPLGLIWSIRKGGRRYILLGSLPVVVIVGLLVFKFLN